MTQESILFNNALMKNSKQTDSDMSVTPEEVALPDIRQSLAHTILAFGFVLINVQNPFKEHIFDNWMNAVVLISMPIAAIISWVLFAKRLKVWKNLPQDIRSRITKTPELLKNRAVTHMLISLLAAGLAAIGYIGHLVSPLQNHFGDGLTNAILSADAVVGVISISILSSTVRDLVSFFKNTSGTAA